MLVSDYIAQYLAAQGITDVFGIPGGVVLDLLYAFKRCNGIEPHLCYHEQAAGFAACGYSQASGKLGVAYATRGPGFTNLISAIADTYSDSVPVIFITGHAAKSLTPNMRVVADQELDTCDIVKSITKYAVRIDSVEQFLDEFKKAVSMAQVGRRGPVLLDVASYIWKAEVGEDLSVAECGVSEEFCLEDAETIVKMIMEAKRPVFLIGDGIHQTAQEKQFAALASKIKIPIISSRYTHDIVGDGKRYFGYIGSHGIRTANFVLSKADLVISLGNRLSFPLASESFAPITEKATFIRIETDDGELERNLPRSKVYRTSLNAFFSVLEKSNVDCGRHKTWNNTCAEIRNSLSDEDLNSAVCRIESLISTMPEESIIVADVGNNEFWVSRACVHTRTNKRTLYSKSFGSLGCALGKAVGAYYATGYPIVCFVGDQGFQLNIQELQTISQNQIPVGVVLLNNHSSGMIKDRQTLLFKGDYLHTTLYSGYGAPNFKRIAEGYGLPYTRISMRDNDVINKMELPCVIEIEIDENIGLSPYLPKGNHIQNMAPILEPDKYNYLNGL